jgi:hypothetical protein
VNIRFPASKIGVHSIDNEVVRVEAGTGQPPLGFAEPFVQDCFGAGSASELRGVKVDSSATPYSPALGPRSALGHLQVGWRILKVDGVPMPVDDHFYIKEQIIQRINAGADMRPVHTCVLFERGAIVACALHATAIIRFLKYGRLLRLQGLTLTSSSPR